MDVSMGTISSFKVYQASGCSVVAKVDPECSINHNWIKQPFCPG